MTRVIKPLALLNVAVALAFALPLLVWIAAEILSRGTLEVKTPSVETPDQMLALIQSTQDVEKLRHRAKMLVEMREFDRRHQQFQAHIMKQMYQWVWAFMGIISTAFLVNAGLMYWALARDKRASQPGAL